MSKVFLPWPDATRPGGFEQDTWLEPTVENAETEIPRRFYLDFIAFWEALVFNVVFLLCRHSFYGQLLEHLVLPYCPALLSVLFTVIAVAFIYSGQINVVDDDDDDDDDLI